MPRYRVKSKNKNKYHIKRRSVANQIINDTKNTESKGVSNPITPPVYPWSAQRNVNGKIEQIDRETLERKEEEGNTAYVFPKTGMSPVLRYSILDPNNPERSLELDDTQLGAVNLVLSGASCCIVGAAGTGKSTILQAILEILAPKLGKTSYRVVRSSGERAEGPSAALISFTNKAVNVIASKIQASPLLREYDFGANITTGHNLLEYTRVQAWNEEQQKEVMRFEEQRGEWSRLDVTHLLIDEASMVGVGTENANQLGNKLHNALEDGTQEVLMGDINQLPPVGGKSILSYGLNKLPIAELTTIHRQALDSPIIAQAWKVLQGEVPEDMVNIETESIVRKLTPKKRRGNGEGSINKNTKDTTTTKLSAATMNKWIDKNFPQFIEHGFFVPGRDIVLSPVNKPHDKQGRPYVSTSHINAVIATHLAEKEKREVYEIIAGFNKCYLAVGDRVMVNKIGGTVTDIKRNAKYVGKMPREASRDLTYFGWKRGNGNGSNNNSDSDSSDSSAPSYDYASLDLDSIIELDLGEHNDSEDKEEGRQASHVVNVVLDAGCYLPQKLEFWHKLGVGTTGQQTVVLNASGEFGPTVFSLGYAISIHKSQGSEWENVFVVLHDMLPGMLSRELLYTAATRPKSKLFLVAQDHVLARCVKSARIKGKGLAGKIAFFNEGDYLNAGEAFGFDRLN